MNDTQKRILIGAVIALAISIYLLALSNRYMTMSNGGNQHIFDKWTGGLKF